MAGFSLRGWDIAPQPDYPYPFQIGDVLDLLHPWSWPLGCEADAWHVSPPCQLFTTAGHLRTAQGAKSKESVDLLTPTIARLRRFWPDTPWAVENVDDNTKQARKIMKPREGEFLTMLCGSMFGLGVQRHRLFLTNFPVAQPACDHKRFPKDPKTGKPRPWGVYHVAGDAIPSGGRTARDAAHARELMGVTRDLPWDTIKEGFPPAYTAFIGAHMLAAVHAGKPGTWLDDARRRTDEWAIRQRQHGLSFGAIARVLGISRQAAQKRYGEKSAGS